MKNKLGFWLMFCFLTLPVTTQAVGDPNRQGPLNNPGPRIVTGIIKTISNNKISIKTDEGKIRIFTLTSLEQSEYVNKGLKKGDRIILSLNHWGKLVGIDKIDEGIPYDKDLWLTGNTWIR